MSRDDFNRVKLAVQERLGATLPEEDFDAFDLVLDDRQPVHVGFDADTAMLTIRAPVSLPPGALSAEAKRYLLSRNLPAAGMAGAMVRTTPGGRRIELVNVLPVAAMPPAGIAGMAVNQGAEAMRLSSWLADKATRN